MKQPALRILLGAVALAAAVLPASASKYTTQFSEATWMAEIFSDDERSERPARSRRAARQADDDSAPVPRSRKRVPAVSYDDVGSGTRAGSGIASYYWQPQRVASGGWFNPNAMTAAHKTLPFGTRVRVTNHGTGRSVTVTINDRGPYVRGRVIDLSSAAAGAIGMKGAGLARVSMTVVGR